jgi:hypothetical protein
VNVRQLQTPIISLLLVISLSGCSVLNWKSVKPVEVQTKAVERTRLNLSDPSPLKLDPVKWVLITPENADKVWEDLKERKVDLVLFALTDEGYEQLAVTMLEIRHYIEQQKAIIIRYREYYEPQEKQSTK